MPNPSRGARRRRSNPRRHNFVRRARRANPQRLSGARTYRRRRRNPSLDGRTIKLGLYGAAGALGVRAGTQLVLGAKNTGPVGWIGNLVAAVALSWGGEKVLGPDAGTGILIGGIISTVLRIAREKLFGSSAISDQTSAAGMGDADFALGDIVQNWYAMPSNVTGADQIVQPPGGPWMPPPPPPPATQKGLSGYDQGYAGGRGGVTVERFTSRWN